MLYPCNPRSCFLTACRGSALQRIASFPPESFRKMLMIRTELQIWYHSLLWGDDIRKAADVEKQNCLFDVLPAVMGKLTLSLRSKSISGTE